VSNVGKWEIGPKCGRVDSSGINEIYACTLLVCDDILS
jgi:hypothetical protein